MTTSSRQGPTGDPTGEGRFRRRVATIVPLFALIGAVFGAIVAANSGGWEVVVGAAVGGAALGVLVALMLDQIPRGGADRGEPPA
jgi:membrane associated rhomboid family serine protease